MTHPLRIIAAAVLSLMVNLNCHAAELVIGQVAQFNSDPTGPGRQVRAGIQIYFDAVNARGGVHGNTLTLIAKDRSLKSEDAVAKVRELIKESEPLAFVGLPGTGAMRALVDSGVLKESGVPVVGIRTGSPSLESPVNPLLFHTRANYAAEVDTITTQLATVSLNRIAVFYENSAFGKEGLSLIERAGKAKNLHLVATATYEANTTKVDSAVRSLAVAQANAVIVVGTSAAAAEFYKAWRATGNSARVVALSVTDGLEVVKLIGSEKARGLVVTQVVPDPGNDAMPLVREFQINYRKYPQRDTPMNQTVLEGYLAAKVLVEGLKRSGANPTRGKLRAALEAMSEFDAGGVIVGYSPASHAGTRYVESAIILRSGKLMR